MPLMVPHPRSVVASLSLIGQASGCRVARAAGVQSEMELAFAGLHQLCAPMLDHAGHLPAPQRDALPAATRELLVVAAAHPSGDRALVARARRELMATGETVRRRGPGATTMLTAQEASVARLARDGCTNSEIGAQLVLSARTVEWHLRQVFTKLGISSRRELRQALPPLASPPPLSRPAVP